MIWLALFITLIVAIVWPVLLFAAAKYDALKEFGKVYERLSSLAKLGAESNKALSGLSDVIASSLAHGRHHSQQPGESDGSQGQA